MSIASPGNDFRLGAMEAPPAVMSTYLGPALTDFLTKYAAGEATEGYVPAKMELPFGVASIKPMAIPAEDRNRTSPFPYGGNRFEFRAAGSSQNVSMVNTVLNAFTAEGMKVIADRVEAGEEAKAVAQDLLKTHMKCVFNGDGYDPAWPDKAVEQGIWRIDAGVDAICEMTSEKNVEFFGGMGVFTAEECEARKNIMLEHYIGLVEMEVLCLKDMILQHIIPCCEQSPACDIENNKALNDAAAGLVAAAEELAATAGEDLPKAAKMAYNLRFGKMAEVRELCDGAEAVCKDEIWSLATYKDLLFLDTHTAIPSGAVAEEAF
jgi:glutamine synthetase